VSESPAELLRRAAALLEQRAASATPGPWELEHSYDGTRAQGLFVGCDEDDPDSYDGTKGIGGFDLDPDNRWSALVHPGVAPTLATWLRCEAALFKGNPIWPALAVAKALLREGQP